MEIFTVVSLGKKYKICIFVLQLLREATLVHAIPGTAVTADGRGAP